MMCILLVFVILHYINLVLAHSSSYLWSMVDSYLAIKDYTNTLQVLQQIVHQYPNDTQVHMTLGVVYHQQSQYEMALNHYSMMQHYNPHIPENYANIGRLFYEIGNMKDAIQYFHQALDLNNSTFLNVAHPLALAYHHLHLYENAEQVYRSMEAPQTYAYHFDFAVTLQELGKIEEACEQYNTAILLNPMNVLAWINIGALHHQFGDVNQAIKNYKKALEIPNISIEEQVMIKTNLGVAFELIQDIPSALVAFKDAIDALFSPYVGAGVYLEEFDITKLENSQLDSFMSIFSHILRVRNIACKWEDFRELIDYIMKLTVDEQLLQGKKSSILPFDSLLLPLTPTLRKSIAVEYSKHLERPYGNGNGNGKDNDKILQIGSDKIDANTDKQLQKLLHVGYISYDFTDHPTAQLLEGIFVGHRTRSIQQTPMSSNKQRFHITAFGYGRDDGSDQRRRVLDLANDFVNIVQASISESVKVIQESNVHILMDCQGFTRGNRPGIIAAHPALIVVNYLVFPGTSGAGFIDYIVGDHFVVGTEYTEYTLSEKLVVLPHSYQANYYAWVKESRQTLWNDTSKPTDPFVFVNFNKIDKLDSDVFHIWLQILLRVPQSILRLLDPSKHDGKETQTSKLIKKNLYQEAAAMGVLPHRLEFVPRTTKIEHLYRHQQCDLFLDTFVYGAHSTGTDSLYAGLPMLTLVGDSFASRVGLSLLSNVGLEELAVNSRKEYEDLAVKLATHREVLHQIQHKLRQSLPKLNLFNMNQYTQYLETSQMVMYDIAMKSNYTKAHLIIVETK